MTSFFLASFQPRAPMLKEYFVVTNDSTSLFVRRSDVTRYQVCLWEEFSEIFINAHPRFRTWLTCLWVFSQAWTPKLSLSKWTSWISVLDAMSISHLICGQRWARKSKISKSFLVRIHPPCCIISPLRPAQKIVLGPTQKCPTPQLMMIHIQTSCGDTESVSVPASASIYNLKTAILQKEGTPLYRQLLTYHGQSLQDDSNLSDHGISDQATIHLQQIEAVIPGGMLKLRRRRGMRGMRKPVIYLFSPRPIHSTVRVSLVKAWSFSVVYPSVPVKDTDMGQTIVWDVNTHEDHSLTITSGTRVLRIGLNWVIHEVMNTRVKPKLWARMSVSQVPNHQEGSVRVLTSARRSQKAIDWQALGVTDQRCLKSHS